MARLGDICTFQSGGTPSKKVPSYFNGSIPWVTTVALNGGNIDKRDAVDWITEKAIAESAAKIVPKYSVMVGTRVGVGKVAINTVPMSTSQDIISLVGIDEERWSKEYLCKFILAKGNYLNSQARGATIKGIKIETLAELEIPDKALDEQQKIARIIEKVDLLITLQKDQLTKLDQLVKSRFIELFGNTPEDETVAMAETCKVITDGTHQPPKFASAGIPFLFVSNIVTNEINYDTDKYITEETYTELIERTPIEIGDILLSTVGSYGHSAVVKTSKPFCFQRHIAYLKPKEDIVNSEYLHGAILSSDVQRQIDEHVKGIAQKTLNLSEIRKIRLPLPSMELQKQFAAFVKQTDKSKFDLQQSLNKLETLKKALMQQYFG